MCEEWLDVKPEFCPWTGKECGQAIRCFTDGDGYCLKVANIVGEKPKADEKKMCRHWNTCLLSITNDCSGSWEECQNRNCRFMPTFVKIDNLIIPDENVKEWIDALYDGRDCENVD